MSDDYLWDRSGKPDPEVERLERLLSQFRHNRPAPEFPESVSFWDRYRFWFLIPSLATAAVLVLVLAALRHTTPGLRRPSSPSKLESPAWSVARVGGSPEVNGMQMGETARLAVGQWLETNSSSRAVVRVSSIGQVEVDPNTRLRLVGTRSGEHRLALVRGTIHATIWAPPGQFFVDTPSAVAVDLGCAYTLNVDEQGAGLLRVTLGWVGFKLKNRESFIPKGAICRTRPGVGPGTPYFADASSEFKAALEKLDFGNPGRNERAQALQIVLSRSRKRDALTLWHLISRVDSSGRGAVYDRLAILVPPPPGVTRDALSGGDRHALELWWDRLGYGDVTWWRRWERAWTEPSK